MNWLCICVRLWYSLVFSHNYSIYGLVVDLLLVNIDFLGNIWWTDWNLRSSWVLFYDCWWLVKLQVEQTALGKKDPLWGLLKWLLFVSVVCERGLSLSLGSFTSLNFKLISCFVVSLCVSVLDHHSSLLDVGLVEAEPHKSPWFYLCVFSWSSLYLFCGPLYCLMVALLRSMLVLEHSCVTS